MIVSAEAHFPQLLWVREPTVLKKAKRIGLLPLLPATGLCCYVLFIPQNRTHIRGKKQESSQRCGMTLVDRCGTRCQFHPNWESEKEKLCYSLSAANSSGEEGGRIPFFSRTLILISSRSSGLSASTPFTLSRPWPRRLLS